MPTLNSDLDGIRHTLFELNNQADQILVNINQQTGDQNKELHLVRIEETIRNNLQYLNDKLNSLNIKLNDTNDQPIPNFRTTLDQLEFFIEKLKSITTDENISSVPQYPNYVQQINNQLNSVPDIHEHLQNNSPIFRVDQRFFERNLNSQEEFRPYEQPNFKEQLSRNLQILEEKLDRLRTINYERHQRKLADFFTELQSKYENDMAKCQRRITFQSQLKEYSKYCMDFCKSYQGSSDDLKKHFKISCRQKLNNDLEFKHYFHVFLIQFRKDLLQMVLNESKDYLPRSTNLTHCLENDEYYSLYMDKEQLKLIHQFVGKTFNANCLQKFYDLVSTKTPYFELFFLYINDTHHAIDYLNVLKESYLVYVRDFILTLNKKDRELIESNETIQDIFNQLKIFNKKGFEIIHDSEKLLKTMFIRQFKGETWNKTLTCDQSRLTVTSNEDSLIDIEDFIGKSQSLFEQCDKFKQKKPSLKLYLKKSFDLLNESMLTDEIIIKSNSSTPDQKYQANTQLRNKFQFRALIYLDMAKKCNSPCFDKFNYFNQSKYDFIEYDKRTTNEPNIQFHENNFIQLFKQAFAIDDISSMKLYDDMLQINPYFFEAQYQNLLKFYELNNCEKMSHIHKTFTELIRSDTPVIDLFEILIDLKNCRHDRKSRKSSMFLNKILKIKVNNNQNKFLYLQFNKTIYSHEIKFNNEEQLINLLKYGQISIVLLKKNSNKSSELKYHLSNFDFEQLIRGLLRIILKQESNFLELIKLFKKLELVNENEYHKLDEKFRKLLPETRFNLIKCKVDSDHFQSVCEISRSIKEFLIFINPKKSRFNQRILQLKLQRAKLYRQNYYFYLEELELLDILQHQKTDADHNPMIYYRLSYLYQWKGDVQMSIHYINLAGRKYNEKINKKIFKKIEKFKSNLLKLENVKSTESMFFDKNKINLLQIFNLLTKFNFASESYITLGFHLFEEKTPNALLNCLFYHLFEQHDIEEYLQHHENTLTKKYYELQKTQMFILNFIETLNEFRKRYQHRDRKSLEIFREVTAKIDEFQKIQLLDIEFIKIFNDLIEKYHKLQEMQPLDGKFTRIFNDLTQKYPKLQEMQLVNAEFFKILNVLTKGYSKLQADHLLDPKSMEILNHSKDKQILITDFIKAFHKFIEKYRKLRNEQLPEKEFIEAFNKLQQTQLFETEFINAYQDFTRNYSELQVQRMFDTNFIKAFNKKFNTKFKCFFINESIDHKTYTYKNDEIPIILLKTSDSYITIKEVNCSMFLTVLSTTYNAKADLKTVCSKFLDNEISKNILSNSNDSKNIEIFIQAMIEYKSMKIFNEEVIYYLKSDDYKSFCFNFWSLIANLDDNIDLTDTLNYFKELFCESVEEYRKEKEEEHKSALELIDNMIEQSDKKQKHWKLLNKFKEKIIQNLSEYRNVSRKYEKRKKLSDIMLSMDEINEKFKQILSKDCFDIDLEFNDTHEEQSFYQYLKASDENEIPFQLLLIIQDSLSEPEINIDGSNLIVTTYNIFLSDIIRNIQTKIKDLNIQTVTFYGTNVFIDLSLENEYWHGINLICGSDVIDFVKEEPNTKITINLTGKKGADGKDAENQPDAKRESEDGLDGLPGEDGQVGGNGGNIFFVANKQLKGRENIEKLITSGGDGGKGGKGGNGGKGHDGKNGEDAEEDNDLNFLIRGYYFIHGKPGTRGGDGGQGGDAGLGGFGGYAGAVDIEENQMKINDTLVNKIESIDKSNISAEHGLPGEGGKSGEGGHDGNDVLFHRYHNFCKQDVYRGYIKITKDEWGYFTYTVEFEYVKRPKKPDGISKGQGKTADIQINAGKVRQKSENKEKSNEQQIKNQLNEVINKNDIRTNNISNNISNAINLLADQRNEMLNERATLVKTHQLSNSLLENANQIAQEALKLNATKIKSKIENNILKTSDTDNKQDNKSANQLKFSIDTNPQLSICFQTDNLLNQRLIISYKLKKDQLIRQFDEKIKEIDKKILSLKYKGKHVLFKIDIDASKSFLIQKNQTNQVKLSSLDGNEIPNATDDLLFNEDFSLLTKTFETVCYYPISKEHEPFVLKQYFHDLEMLKQEKKRFIRTRNKLEQLNIDLFINEICLEYGCEELINYKMLKFDEFIHFDLFDMKKFIKQNDFPIDEITTYQRDLTNLFQNQSIDSQIIEEVSNILIASKISIKRIEKSTKFLYLLFDILQGKKKFKEFKVNECTPIYHCKESTGIYIIEQLMYQFLQAKDKNLELLARIFNCFKKIIEKQEDKILCMKKIENFLEFLKEHLLIIPVDSNQGSLLHAMRRDLNFIQIHCLSKLFYDLFDELELIIIIREQQFEKLKNYTDKIETYFQEKQNEDIDQDIQIINHVDKHRKPDILHLFQQNITSIRINFQNNSAVKTFINDLCLSDTFKSKIEITLINFYAYLTSVTEYKYNCIITDKKKFFRKLKLFLKQEKNKKKINLDNILIHKRKCESIVQLLYQNMNLQTNINFLNDIDFSKTLDLTEFVQNVKNLYDKLRLQKLREINEDQTSIEIIDLSKSDYNKNIGYIYLLSRELNNDDKTQIKNRTKIVIKTNNENQFMIYFRNNQNFEVQTHLLVEPSLIELLNKLNFSNDETKLSKENESNIYQSVYKEIQANNGFTKYSIEQIESFTKLKEFVYENLPVLKNELGANFYKYIADEIDRIFNLEFPDIWSRRIYCIFNNINIITTLQKKFQNDLNSPTPNNIVTSVLNDLITYPISKDVQNLLENKEDDIIIIFYKFLSIYDHLLIQITKKELNISFKVQFDEIAQTLSGKYQQKDDFMNNILYEIIVKNNQILKQYYSNDISNIPEQSRTKISTSINLLSLDLNKQKLIENIQINFKHLIDKGYLTLLDYIDQIYTISSNRLNVSRKHTIYSNLMQMINEFYTRTDVNSSIESFIEKSVLFLKRLQKQCLIFTSGLNNIDQSEIKRILTELKTNCTTFQRCSLKVLSRDHLNTSVQNQIILKQKMDQSTREYFSMKKSSLKSSLIVL
ncbi:unnamed protein product [Adineta steineri]|uniref:Uncharacterized protein n=1 Tax=Adineta steineri TaxID=433720 RepID=A0A818MIP6_9BILA|nr:unnamed protein product [Adineta steineri]CAF3589973.1 unnamed protein product [Adineta steineri]